MASGDEDEIIKAGPSGVNLIPRIHLGLPKITEEGKRLYRRVTQLPPLVTAAACLYTIVQDA
jgi:hypothetical protein